MNTGEIRAWLRQEWEAEGLLFYGSTVVAGLIFGLILAVAA